MNSNARLDIERGVVLAKPASAVGPDVESSAISSAGVSGELRAFVDRVVVPLLVLRLSPEERYLYGADRPGYADEHQFQEAA